MRRLARCMLWSFLMLAGAAASATEPAHVRVASEVWEEHTQADGSGLAWDILRAVYEPAGLQLQTLSMPYTRAIGLTQRGEVDAWVGAYANEVRHRIVYPRWHYDVEPIVALGLASSPVPTLENLGTFRLSWLRGYEFQRYLPNLRQYREVIRTGGILGMLAAGRADFYIDALDEVEGVLRNAQEPSTYRISPLSKLPLYLGFADNARGRSLAELYDQRMDLLVANGSLRPIFARWQQPYPY